MNHTPFQSFIDLISLDQKIRTIYQTITQLKKETELHVAEKAKLTHMLEQFKQHVHELKKHVHEKELHIKELDTLEKEKKQKLDQLQNPKEYQPLKKEIERLKQEQHNTEASLMTIWNKLEVAQKELDEQQASYNAKIDELHTIISQQQDKVAALQTELEQKKSERPARETGIPQEWLEKYTHMRMRVEDPVVEALDSSCSACYYTIAHQEMIRLKRRAIIQCKGCFRLLYLPEAMKEDSTEVVEK